MLRRFPEKTSLQEEKPRRFCQESRQCPVAFQQEIPVREGQELEVVADNIGRLRDETARIHGFSIFVPNAKIGERLNVRTVNGFALAEEVNETGGES